MKIVKFCSLLAVFITTSIATAAEKTVCHESPRYLIIEGSTGEVGTHFLVKYKSEKGQAPVCDYVPEADDFEIRNEDAEYFLGLQQDLLILDSGTGPDPRGLVIWDLKKREKVYTGNYSEAKIEWGYMEFWVRTSDATDENCPQAKEWSDSGLEAQIETKVSLNLSNFKITKSLETRCSPLQ